MATKVFKERGISAEGKVLPLSKFKLFSDMDNPIVVPEKIDLIIKKAEEIVDNEIPFIPLSNYREFKITGNRSNFQSKYYARRDMLLYLALAEHFENKGRFKSKLVDVVWAVLEETSWVIHAHAIHNPADPKADVPPVYNETDLHGIDLFSAVTGALFATVLLLCREQLDSISPILAERIEYEVKKRIIKPFISHHFSWCGEYGSKVNNWCPWITENVLFITAVVEGNQRIRETVVARAMKYLDNYTTWLPDDGGCDEGPSYWSAAGGSYFSALEIIYDMTGGAIDVFDHPLVKTEKQAERRAELIAKDQVQKATQGFAIENAKAYGATKGEWIHIPGEKSSRITHMEMDGHTFDLDKGLYDPDVGEFVLPGQLIYCMCSFSALWPGTE